MTDTFYPFLNPQLVKENLLSVPLAKEYAYNMDTAQFLLQNGRQYFVVENEALKVKIWKLFMSEKYKWVVFPWEYGHELESIIGKAYTQGYINSEAERFIKEAIFTNLGDYVKRLEDLKICFENGKLTVYFVAITIYGRLEISGMPIYFY